MKNKFLNTLSIVVFGCLFSLHSIAQTDAEQITPYREFQNYRNPSENDFRPVKVNLAEAINETNSSEEETGFNTLFFGKEELLAILNQPNCIGIRFYNVLADSTTTIVSLLAVGVLENGAEINGGSTQNYLLSRTSLEGTLVPIKVEIQVAQAYAMSAYQNTQIKTYTTFFSNTDLSNLLKGGTCKGLKLRSGNRLFALPEEGPAKKCYSILAMPVKKDGSDMNTTYLKSLEPCPTFCPNDNFLLIPAGE